MGENDFSGWGTDSGGSLGDAFYGSSNWGGDNAGSGNINDWSLGGAGLSVNPGEFDFSSFDDSGFGMDNGSYSDASTSGYSPSENGFLDFFTENPFAKGALALLGQKNPFAGQILGMATKGATGAKDPTEGTMGRNIVGTLGAIGGGALFGPPGAMAGGYLGSQLGQSVFGGRSAYTGAGPETSPGDKGNSMGFGTGIVLGLDSLYQGYKNNKESGGQLSSLQGMYGQNSPYAKVLQQQLSRRDAAGGRRSQYGPREVELQAALANAASRNAPAINQLLQMRQGQRGQKVSQLAGLYQQMGGARGIQDGLQGLYSDVGGMFTGMNQYDNTGYSIGEGTADFNDVLPDTWGG